jgi:hypothetical protein
VPYRPFGSRTNDEIERRLLSAGVAVEDMFGERPTAAGLRYLKSLSPKDWVGLLKVAQTRRVAIKCDARAMDQNRDDWHRWRNYVESEQHRRFIATEGEFGVETPRPWTRTGGFRLGDEHSVFVRKVHWKTQKRVLAEMTEAA